MKKFIFVILALVFIAAGCNKTQPQSAAPITTPDAESGNSVQTYTLADVATANNAQNCLTVIDGIVYNLTSWVSKHPGGPDKILSICGKDGTSAFRGQHGQSKNNILNGFKAGELK
jgi:cytochrome b involved in lipid metabolism